MISSCVVAITLRDVVVAQRLRRPFLEYEGTPRFFGVLMTNWRQSLRVTMKRRRFEDCLVVRIRHRAWTPTTSEKLLVHLYELTYPDYIEKRKGDLVMYLFIFLMVFLYGVISGLGFLSFVPYGTVCMLHACGHLEIAKNRIDSLFTGDSRYVNEKLKNIAQLLQYTYHFIEYSNGCLRFFYDAILKLSAIAIPVTFYALLEGLRHGVFSMEFTMFILNAIMLTSIPCYLSDKLLEKGEEVRLALYSCGWECEYNRRMRVTILLLQTRCSRPIAVQTMFTTLCLYAVTDMFQQAYTILNLMNAVWN
ncbi:unnamed protein product [Spodoptera exigua]|nr:unnamed protein product [Spodoptera exigua]